MKMQKSEKKKKYFVRAYISLGDGYFKMEDTPKAKAIWQEGAKLYPENAGLKGQAFEGRRRLLAAYINDVLDPRTSGVDTDLHEIWEGQ